MGAPSKAKAGRDRERRAQDQQQSTGIDQGVTSGHALRWNIFTEENHVRFQRTRAAIQAADEPEFLYYLRWNLDVSIWLHTVTEPAVEEWVSFGEALV